MKRRTLPPMFPNFRTDDCRNKPEESDSVTNNGELVADVSDVPMPTAVLSLLCVLAQNTDKVIRAAFYCCLSPASPCDAAMLRFDHVVLVVRCGSRGKDPRSAI